MYAEIILHRKVPQKFDSFTYRIPEDFTLTPGQMVQVPFKKQTLSGIVRKIHRDTPSYSTKFIETKSDLILSKWQMDLAEWMSEKYSCSFSKTIDLFVPEKVWVSNQALRIRHPTYAKASSLRAKGAPAGGAAGKQDTSLEVQEFIEKLLAPNKPKLVVENSPLPRRAFYSQMAGAIPQGSQALFLFPETFYINQSTSDIPVFHGGLKEAQKADTWHSVKNGKMRAIAGTRGALFLPFANLKCIVVDFEHNENYNEKRAPRYNALEIAEKLSKLLSIPLIAISGTPHVETWLKMQTGAYERCEWGNFSLNPKISIVNMADERRSGNFGVFSDVAMQKIAANLSRDKQVLLFINRVGRAGAVMCRDCGDIFRCPTCSSSLTLHNENSLVCSKCKTSSLLPSACDKCGNTKLKSLGFGTERLENDIKKVFGKAKVLRLDRETVNKKDKLDEKAMNAADILVATQIVDKPLHLPRLNLSIAVMPDPLLHFPDFRATERVFQLLTRVWHLTHPKGEFLIQTFMPEHSLWDAMAKNRVEDFYKNELSTRKSLSLPPY